MAQIDVKVNGRAVSRHVEDRTLLVEFLRETMSGAIPGNAVPAWCIWTVTP
jgi:aerobic-type carbon monoxide dehydrogenase small subunit (CoxS/CutS family)